MNLPVNFLKTFLPELIEKNVKIETIGFYEGLPQSTIDAIDFAKAKTQHNTGLTLVFAINYGGRAEIIQSMKAIYNELQLNGQGSEVIDEALIKRHLMTHSYPDPDLLIRTSGEQRISNFLIWQASYSEFILMKSYGQILMKRVKRVFENISITPKTFWRIKRSKNESKNINRDYSLINILAHLAQRWLNINAFRILISFDSLKRTT